MKSCVMAGWLMTVSVGNAIVVVFAEARLTDDMVRRAVLFSSLVNRCKKFVFHYLTENRALQSKRIKVWALIRTALFWY